MEDIVAERLAGMLGIPGFKTMQDIDVIKKIMQRAGTPQELMEELSSQGIKSTERVIHDGFKRLDDLVPPMTRIVNLLEVTLVPVLQVVGNVMSVIDPSLLRAIITTAVGRAAGRAVAGRVGGWVGAAIGLAAAPVVTEVAGMETSEERTTR